MKPVPFVRLKPDARKSHCAHRRIRCGDLAGVGDDNNRIGRRMAALHERITKGYEQVSVPVQVIVSQLRLVAERLASVLRSACP